MNKDLNALDHYCLYKVISSFNLPYAFMKTTHNNFPKRGLLII